ncbi:hypothetical protein HNV10_16740 [Winogradskyella litoriviva]|uniref:DUF4131 domain-containing protein n=1 Tax=Winogradskyella litoriviva TaxID=1220182 RepID=A0ABX2EBP0_9FLAO|nr:hypothetical protein [Winogradskyella litoriviva]NRD24904.1 hypothetical protein [Winogradskyella litoriviva]
MSYYHKYIHSFWLPLLALIGILIVRTIGIINGSRIIYKVFPYITYLIIFSIGISLIINLSRKNWTHAVLKLIISLFLILFFFIIVNPTDLFFSNLDIPKNIKYEKPVNLNSLSIDSIKKNKSYNENFYLSGELGIYETIVWIKPKEDGEIYLRAFEEVGNIELSASRLKERSKVRVTKNELTLYNQDFTIYEGVWEKYYIARIEIWMNPKVGQDYKLKDKVFLIDGWVR